MRNPQLKVLVVDDEPDIPVMIECALAEAGFECLEAGDAVSAQRQIDEYHPDVVVLDWMLPECSGLELLGQLRRQAATRTLPVIMLSARTETDDRAQALETGADDYVCKPFSPRELRARIHAVLRRCESIALDEGAVIRRGNLVVDCAARRVWFKDQEVRLSPQEFELLQFLAAHPEEAFSRAALMSRVWGEHRRRLERTIDVHIRRLRKALATVHGDGMIQTVRGIGYRFSLHGESAD